MKLSPPLPLPGWPLRDNYITNTRVTKYQSPLYGLKATVLAQNAVEVVDVVPVPLFAQKRDPFLADSDGSGTYFLG